MIDPTKRPGSPEVTRTLVHKLQPGGQAQQLVRAMLEQGMTCCVCGGSPAIAGVFIPRDQAAKPPGKRKTCWYLLCQSCLALPDREAQVEAALRRHLASHLVATAEPARGD
jgi:hypothetical protein